LYGATVIAFARLVRISPVGASLKYAFVAAASSSLSSASTWLGKVPAFSNALSCVSGEVSHAASCDAASTLSPLAGTTRYEPPQLPPPPGNASAMSQPVVSGALPSMTPSIQPGHSMVANSPLASDANQSSLH